METNKTYSHISCEQLHLEREKWQLVDIRDAQSYSLAHIAGAYQLNNQTIGDFLSTTQASQPVAVICYHGHSSQQAAEYLVSQGLTNVASVDGGFEYWRQNFPVEGAQ